MTMREYRLPYDFARSIGGHPLYSSGTRICKQTAKLAILIDTDRIEELLSYGNEVMQLKKLQHILLHTIFLGNIPMLDLFLKFVILLLKYKW